MLTEIRVLITLFIKCPHCDKELVNGDNIKTTNYMITQTVECPACGKILSISKEYSNIVTVR